MKSLRTLHLALPLVVAVSLVSAAGSDAAPKNGTRVAQAPGKGKAITKDEIVKMSKAGIPDSVIIGKIQKSAAVFKLEVSDIIALKKAGVSDKVIEAMVNTEVNEGRPPVDSAPKGTPRAAATRTPGPSEEEEILGVKPPDPGFEESSGSWGGPMAGNMAQAATLYRDGKWEQASDMLFGLLEANKVPSKEIPETQKRLADSLYNMGLSQAALYSYQDSVENGFVAGALPRVIELSDRLKDDRRLLGILDKIQPGNIPAELRRDAGYFYGQLYFRKEDMESAKKALAAVPTDSRFYGRARYTKGVIHSLEGANEPAIAAFKEAIDAGDGPAKANLKPKPEDAPADEVEAQARQALARTLYAARKYNEAVDQFRLVSRDSGRWASSLFDNAWGLYKDGEYGYALGNVLSTRAPFFDAFYQPEANILEAIVYYRLCLFPQASNTINLFEQRFNPYKAKIASFVRQAEKRPPEQVFAFLKDFVDSPRGKAASFMPSDLMLAVAEDGKISDILFHLKAIELEQQRIRDIGPWRGSRVAAAVMDRMNDHKAKLSRLGGQLVLNEFKRHQEDLDTFLAEAKNIKFEITLGERNALEAELTGQGKGAATHKEKEVAVLVPDDHYYWPFEGEYWKDEVGYYKFSVQGVCAK